jgi:hypothetical protein
MKNISKPALLNLRFPLPDPNDQRTLIASLTDARQTAETKLTEARTLRATAWSAFESALFTSVPATGK